MRHRSFLTTISFPLSHFLLISILYYLSVVVLWWGNRIIQAYVPLNSIFMWQRYQKCMLLLIILRWIMKISCWYFWYAGNIEEFHKFSISSMPLWISGYHFEFISSQASNMYYNTTSAAVWKCIKQTRSLSSDNVLLLSRWCNAELKY